MSRDALVLRSVRGLEGLWLRATRRGSRTPAHPHGQRMLLDTLGLGLEQTLGHLGSETPDFDSFLEWVVATAGPVDPVRLARYNAVLDGAAAPLEVQAHLDGIDAADPVLDAAELERWDRDGYAILRGAITAEQAHRAAATVWEAAGARPDMPDSWYGQRNNGIMVQRFQHPALQPARRSPRVHKAFAQLWGTSDLWMTIDRVGFSAPERPEHRFAAPRLHWDVSLVPPIPFGTQAILYLTDTAEDQGALELVPGFHRRIEAWLDGLGDADPRRVDLSDAAIRVAAGAGDLIIWRQDLPHGASPNLSDRPRIVQYMTMYSPAAPVQAKWR
jgi:hypothetical protein